MKVWEFIFLKFSGILITTNKSISLLGVPWTEDEHRLFLLGLKNLGKGDWRGISKNYVPSRTPTQVASHAQKYFIRKTTTEKKKRRSSVFDMAFKEQVSHCFPSQPLFECFTHFSRCMCVCVYIYVND